MCWKTPITLGRSGTLNGCQGCLHQTFFHQGHNSMFKKLRRSWFLDSVVISWSGSGYKEGMGLKTARCVGLGTEFTLAPLSSVRHMRS